MKSHHLAWLRSHPHRTREWLRQRLAEGFEVHHVDGDHHNDHPGNLALIEVTDHHRLHGMFKLRTEINAGRKGGLAAAAKLSPEQRSERGRRAAMARWRSRQNARVEATRLALQARI